MKQYYSDIKIRAKVQTAMYVSQGILMILAAVFTALLVSTPAPSDRTDFTAAAVIFDAIWSAVCFSQLIFAVDTDKRIIQKTKFDSVFVMGIAQWSKWQRVNAHYAEKTTLQGRVF